MKKIITGDTILFKTTAHDQGGTAIQTAVVTLTVNDFSGSQVLNTTVPHITGGTYYSNESTAGWGFGPITQNWTIEDSAGTLTKLVKNEFKVVSDGTIATTYIYEDELKSYFPSIADYLNSESEDHVLAAYKYTNRVLDGLGYETPVPASDDSLFDQSIRDHNAWDAIYRIVKSDQIDKVRKDEDGKYWFDSFAEAADDVYQDWKSKKIVFKRKVSPGEAGIGLARRTQGSSVGSMLTNHDEVYGSGFRGSDYKRTWSALITGTGTSGGLRECTFVWSKDGGLGTTVGTTSDSWIHLDDQVYIRFTRGTSTGTTNIFVVGDKWEWITNPVRNQTGGKGIAVGYG